MATEVIAAPGVPADRVADARRSCHRWPTRPPKAARSSNSRGKNTGLSRTLPAGGHVDTVQRHDEAVWTWTASDEQLAQGMRWTPCIGSSASLAAGNPQRSRRGCGPHLALRRDAAGRRSENGKSHGRHPPQGRRQAGREGALRRSPSHGSAHGDDHRRQSGHRGDDRIRSRCRRLPGRGHARGQAGA